MKKEPKYELVFSTRKKVESILSTKDHVAGRTDVPVEEWLGFKTTEYLTASEIKERYGK